MLRLHMSARYHGYFLTPPLPSHACADMQRLDVTLSRKMVAGAEPSDFVAEWERKLRAKSRRKRPQAPVVENFVLQPREPRMERK